MSQDSVVGVVKFFSQQRGFGFIWPLSEMHKPEELPKNEGGREELFFHATEVQNPNGDTEYKLVSGDEVQFEVAEGDRGQMAVKIMRLRAAKEKNKTSLVATNSTIGVKKSHIPVLAHVLEELTAERNRSNFGDNELEALVELYKTLKNAEGKLNYSHTPATPVVTKVSSTIPATAEVSKPSRSKKNQQPSA